MSLSAFAQLEKGPRQSFDKLMDLHDRFAISGDPFMRYAAGWAAMYAAQKGLNNDTDYAQGLAESHWGELDHPIDSVYVDSPKVLYIESQLAMGMSDQIRFSRKIWTPDERLLVGRTLGDIATDFVSDVVKDDPNVRGKLAEVACMQLLWRRSPDLENLNTINAIPAGPAKDQRRGWSAPFSTDIYAHVSGAGRVHRPANIQMKSTATAKDRERYADIVAVVGANTHFAHPSATATTKQRIIFTVGECSREANQETLTEQVKNTLDQSSRKIHSDIKPILDMRNSKQKPMVKV